VTLLRTVEGRIDTTSSKLEVKPLERCQEKLQTFPVRKRNEVNP